MLRRRPRGESPAPGQGLDRLHLTALAGLVLGLVVVLGMQAWLTLAPRDEAEAAAARLDLARFSVFMHRQGCALGCPVYAVLADGRGTLRYEGVSGVALVDRAEVELASGVARALAAEVLRAGFQTQPDEWVPGGAWCQEWRQGAEILRFGVTLDGVTRTLDYYAGCTPTNQALDHLAQRIDALLDTRRWTGAAAPR